MKKKTTAKPARLASAPRPDNSSAPIIDLVPSYLRLKKILVPVDFSDFSVKALKYAVRFAEQFRSELILVHVVKPVHYPESIIIPPAMETANQERLKLARTAVTEFAKRQVPAGVESTSLARLGQPFAELTAAARECEADLIVIATHGHTGLKHLFLGSTAERVVRLAPCPVLTVRAHEHEFV